MEAHHPGPTEVGQVGGGAAGRDPARNATFTSVAAAAAMWVLSADTPVMAGRPGAGVTTMLVTPARTAAAVVCS